MITEIEKVPTYNPNLRDDEQSWEFYIGDDVVMLWDTLPGCVRVNLYELAQQAADVLSASWDKEFSD